MRHIISCAVLLAVVLAFGGRAFAEDAEAEAKEFVEVLRKDTTDTAALSAKVLERAKSAKENAPLQAALYEQAYELGRKSPEGWPVAVEAAELLSEARPDERTEWLENVVAVRRLQLRRARGDEQKTIKEKLDEAVGRLKVWKDIEKYQRKVDGGSDSTRDREQLIELYVTELDEPGEAAKYLTDKVGEAWRKHVPLAVKAAEDLTEPESRALADWYYDHCFQRGDRLARHEIGTVPLLRRASTYYERYLGLHTDEDADRLEAQSKLAKARKALAELADPIDLLALIDPAEHAIDGKWAKEGATLVVPTQEVAFPRVRVPVHPDGSYELTAEFDLAAAPSIFLIVGNTMCVVHFSKYGSQMDWIGDSPSTEPNPTHYEGGRLQGKTCRAYVRVELIGQDKACILVKGNDVELINWNGKITDLSLQSWLKLKGTLGLGVGGGERKRRTEFRSLKLKMLSGEAKRLEE